MTCSLFSHAGRLYLSAPLPGQTVLGALYVWDTRSQGQGGQIDYQEQFLGASGNWTRWLASAVANGFVLAGDADTNDLYLAGAEGQIYLVDGNVNGDRTLPSDATTAVSMVIAGKKYTDSQQNRQLLAQRFSATLDSADSAPAYTFVVVGDRSPDNLWSAGYTASVAGESTITRLQVASRARGRGLTWGITAASTAAVTLRRVAVVATPGKQS